MAITVNTDEFEAKEGRKPEPNELRPWFFNFERGNFSIPATRPYNTAVAYAKKCVELRHGTKFGTLYLDSWGPRHN